MRSVGDTFSRIRVTRLGTLDDVYEAAHEMESSELNTVFKVIGMQVADYHEGRELLAAQLDEHTEKLISFGRSMSRAQRASVRVSTTDGGESEDAPLP